MATALRVNLSLNDCGVFHTSSVNKDAAATASDALQENHEKHHIFYNRSGFHNHIAHHLLTLYSLGASETQIQKQYNENKVMQRPPPPLDEVVLEDLHDFKKFHEYLACERYYHDFLVFFQEEIGKQGYEAVINKYVLQGDERADDMLVRMYAGECSWPPSGLMIY